MATSRLLVSSVEQAVANRGPGRRVLVDAATGAWAHAAMARVGGALASSLVPGVPPVALTTVDRGTGRVTSVRGRRVTGTHSDTQWHVQPGEATLSHVPAPRDVVCTPAYELFPLDDEG
jgi:hypothetical protein